MSEVKSSSSWIHDASLSWFHRIMFYILKRGKIPKHVAIVMDGNRRFAKKSQVEKIEGHEKGFGKLSQTLRWCLDLDIHEVTVYAFSIQNFQRSQDEVDSLMNLARDKFKKLVEEWEKLQSLGICVRIIGNLNLLPTDLLKIMMIAMLITKDNKKSYLNIAFPYIGKDEMVSTALPIIDSLKNGIIDRNEMDEDIFSSCLYTCHSPPPDLLIRTSGEHRLSDFLTWQSSYSYIHFVNTLWPEFSAWNMCQAVFCYQHFHNQMKTSTSQWNSNNKNSSKIHNFVSNLQEERLQEILETCEKKGDHINYVELRSLCASELFEYYKENFSN